MKYSVIDIGSNSVRLTVYRVKDGAFRILFKDKKMAGLAGYVENGCISDAGIERACDTLLEFRNTLHLLGITDRIYAFATASLRELRQRRGVSQDNGSDRLRYRYNNGRAGSDTRIYRCDARTSCIGRRVHRYRRRQHGRSHFSETGACSSLEATAWDR